VRPSKRVREIAFAIVQDAGQRDLVDGPRVGRHGKKDFAPARRYFPAPWSFWLERNARLRLWRHGPPERDRKGGRNQKYGCDTRDSHGPHKCTFQNDHVFPFREKLTLG